MSILAGSAARGGDLTDGRRTSFASDLARSSTRRVSDDEQEDYLDQGWTPELRELFYFTPQGSHLMPYDWFISLERPDDTELFDARENLSRFGWLFTYGRAGRPDSIRTVFPSDSPAIPNAHSKL